MSVPPAVLEALVGIVGERWVRTGTAELETYAADALPTRRRRPGAVVLPGDAAEVGSSHARTLFFRDRRPELYADWLVP